MLKSVPIKEHYFIIEYTLDCKQREWDEWDGKTYLSVTQAQEWAKELAYTHLTVHEQRVYGFRVLEVNTVTEVNIVTEFLI